MRSSRRNLLEHNSRRVAAAVMVMATVVLAGCAAVAVGVPTQPSAPVQDSRTPTAVPTVTTPAKPPSDAACKLVSWDDLPAGLPAEVRGTSKPEPVGSPDPAEAECRLDNSVLAVISGPGLDPDGNITNLPEVEVDTSDPKYFIIRVSIGNQVRTSPSAYSAPEDVQIGDYTGVRSRERTDDGTPFCVVAFRGGNTKAAVRVTNDRFPAMDGCLVATEMAQRLSERLT